MILNTKNIIFKEEKTMKGTLNCKIRKIFILTILFMVSFSLMMFGADAIYIDTSGNVGIGTTGPDYDMDVSGDINFTGTLYQDGSPFSGGGGSSLWTESGDDIYFDDGNVGIGTTDPSFKLTIEDDGGIIAKGTFGSGTTIPSMGSGTRMVWYPKKAAFRAGYAYSTYWDSAYIGDYSVAFGYKTKANGGYSSAFGYNSRASGYNAFATGSQCIATGNGSFTTGYSNYATGQCSVAMGQSSQATGVWSFARGYYAYASGGHSFANGMYVSVSGGYSTVIGKGYDYNNKLTNGNSNSFMVGYMNSSSDSTPEFYVEDGGVGIGNTSPAYELEISGAVMLEDTSTPSYASGHSGIFSSSGELYSIDAAGNTTQISPHDPETGEWRFYSKNIKTGRVVEIQMEKLVKKIEEITGEDFMKEWIE